MTTVDIIKEIVRTDRSITGIFVHTFPNAPGLEEKLHFDRIEQAHYSSALELRSKYNVPFWDALMLSFYNKKEFSTRILNNVLQSHAKRQKIYLDRQSVLSAGKLDELASSLDNYAFNSEVETVDDRKRHLLLLDFHIPESESNQIIVEKVLELLKVEPGFLLRSGRSYHFIGTELISTYSLISFLSKCLFFTPIIDKSWIAHQLLDKSCSIRITKKRGLFPSLLKAFV